MKQIAIMMAVAERGRADVLLTDSRVYYRFATEDTLEDGDLPGLGDSYILTETRIKEALSPRDGELPMQGVKVSVFIDNMKWNVAEVTEQAIARLVTELVNINDTFAFLHAFE